VAGFDAAARNDRAPALPARFMAGGPGTPLGARHVSGRLGHRIHGTNDPRPSGTASPRAASGSPTMSGLTLTSTRRHQGRFCR
jgi:hypothetical protein